VGGVANSVSRFTEDLRELGHEVLVVAPTFSKKEEAKEDESKVLRVPAIQNFNGSDFSVRIPIPFIIDEKIDEFSPDIVHSHHPYLLGDAGLRAAHRRGLPLVFTHHTLYEQYTHYVTQDSEAMKKFAIHLSTGYANLCTQVIAPSESIADLIRSRGVNTPVKVIPTGVDIDFFSSGDGQKFRKEHKIPEDRLVIGHLGRLAPEKNLAYLAEAVSLYLEKEKNAIFLVIGAGPSEEEIDGIFRDRGVSDRLIMAGKKKGQDVADAYAAMDVFVFSSKSETQGMVLTEAMAAGNPVIALDASGVREVVKDGKNGRLLSGEADENAFSQAISEFAGDKQKANRWKENARETSIRFGRKHCAKELVGLYETVLEKPSSTMEEKKEELVEWEDFLTAVKTEWNLLSEKAKAFYNTVSEQTLDKISGKV
jgi:glycosyltransferase involved in cell wall biosynthesis